MVARSTSHSGKGNRIRHTRPASIRSAPNARWSKALALAVALPLCLTACGAPSLDPVAPPVTSSPTLADRALVTRGAELASIGNCAGCHTTLEGQPLAGGLPLKTPFGTIHSTNITPDPDTGIGKWSKAAFVRAMRDGVSRDGTLLYPAFPYDHFTKVADADLDAIYAYLMTRQPVRADAVANSLSFPFNIRPLVGVWNAMFLKKQPIAADTAQSAEWNRGAYLVGSLGHCASCHTPRNAMGAEKSGRAFEGAVVDGWYAPALNADSPSPLPWTVDKLTSYLRTGLAPDHAIAGGPMQGVVHEMANVSEADVRAIATYVVSRMGEPSDADKARAETAMRLAKAGPLGAQAKAPAAAKNASGRDAAMLALGASVYQNTCASCHDLGRQTSSGGALQMPLAVAIHDPQPNSLIRIVHDGIKPRTGEHGRWMPDYADVLTDEQITALAAWLRQTAAPDAPPWPNLAKAVKEARQP